MHSLRRFLINVNCLLKPAEDWGVYANSKITRFRTNTANCFQTAKMPIGHLFCRWEHFALILMIKNGWGKSDRKTTPFYVTNTRDIGHKQYPPTFTAKVVSEPLIF